LSIIVSRQVANYTTRAITRAPAPLQTEKMRTAVSSITVILTIVLQCTPTTIVTAFQINYPSHASSWKQIQRHSCHHDHRQNKRRRRRQQRQRQPTSLYDLSEWRDLFFDENDKPARVNKVMKEQNMEGPAREVCILPFPIEEALIQGETKELCLYEERFHRLFEKCQNSHGGVLAMGLLAPPAGILQVMPLCEIESFSRMPGKTNFGTSYSILVTIRVVGRAELVHVLEEHESIGLDYLKGWCTEFFDDNSGGSKGSSKSSNSNPTAAESREDSERFFKLSNDFADRLEEVMESIVDLEDQLSMIGENVGNELYQQEKALNDDFDDEDDDEEEEEVENRRSRFHRAYEVAKSTDTQGYTMSTSMSKSRRSIQDLTASSWAYFSSERQPVDIFVYRLRALECENVCQRLKVALMVLMERRSKLKSLMRGTVSEEFREDEEEE